MELSTNKQIPFIRDLCKEETEAQIAEAEATFRRYLLLVKRICERIEREEKDLVEVDKPDEY